ncbi:hypothetical protein BGY98DRAFT_971391, partial [Russula aff. rugulosa BPL654]
MSLSFSDPRRFFLQFHRRSTLQLRHLHVSSYGICSKIEGVFPRLCQLHRFPVVTLTLQDSFCQLLRLLDRRHLSPRINPQGICHAYRPCQVP